MATTMTTSGEAPPPSPPAAAIGRSGGGGSRGEHEGEGSPERHRHHQRREQHERNRRQQQRPGETPSTPPSTPPPASSSTPMPPLNVVRLCGWSASKCGYCHGERAYVLTETETPTTDVAGTAGLEENDPVEEEEEGRSAAERSVPRGRRRRRRRHTTRPHQNGNGDEDGDDDVIDGERPRGTGKERSDSDDTGPGETEGETEEENENENEDECDDEDGDCDMDQGDDHPPGGVNGSSAPAASAAPDDENGDGGGAATTSNDGRGVRTSITPQNSSRSYGTLFERLSCVDYQDLIDRGWRRSGLHLYYPDNWGSCCPAVPIRLHVDDFHRSRSQRKVWNALDRALTRYCRNGAADGGNSPSPASAASSGGVAAAQTNSTSAVVATSTKGGGGGGGTSSSSTRRINAKWNKKVRKICCSASPFSSSSSSSGKKKTKSPIQSPLSFVPPVAVMLGSGSIGSSGSGSMEGRSSIATVEAAPQAAETEAEAEAEAEAAPPSAAEPSARRRRPMRQKRRGAAAASSVEVGPETLLALRRRMRSCVEEVLLLTTASTATRQQPVVPEDVDDLCSFRVLPPDAFGKKERRRRRRRRGQMAGNPGLGAEVAAATAAGGGEASDSRGATGGVGGPKHEGGTAVTVVCSTAACCAVGGRSRGTIKPSDLARDVAGEFRRRHLSNGHQERPTDADGAVCASTGGDDGLGGASSHGGDGSMDCGDDEEAEGGGESSPSLFLPPSVRIVDVEALNSGHVNVTLAVRSDEANSTEMEVVGDGDACDGSTAPESASASQSPRPMTDHLAVALGLDPRMHNGPHTLTVRSVPSEISGDDPEVHRLFARYQAVVHGDEDPFAYDDEDENDDDGDGDETRSSLLPSYAWRTAAGERERRRRSTPEREERIEKARRSFVRFLVESPLPSVAAAYRNNGGDRGHREGRGPGSAEEKQDDDLGPAGGSLFDVDDDGYDVHIPYGSYHQQYRIDGVLVAVGVVDVLPHCLSSVYSFYDPDLSGLGEHGKGEKCPNPLPRLNLGKYTALREIEWVRRAKPHRPDLAYYYLGFYIHSCAKMRYKAEYRPSSLLCPTKMVWVDFEKARPLIEAAAPRHCCTLAVSDGDGSGGDGVDDAHAGGSTPANNSAGEDRPGETSSGPMNGVTAASATSTSGGDIVSNMYLDINPRGGGGADDGDEDPAAGHQRPLVTVGMLNSYGRKLVDPLVEEFVGTVGPTVSRRCIIKL